MSLYREARRGKRAVVVATIAALCAGVALGFLAGRLSGGSQESLPDALAELRERTRVAFDALELVTLEYGQAVRDGQIVAETELQAARRDVEVARERVAAVQPDLEALAPEQAALARQHVDELARLVDRRADPLAIAREARAARDSLARATLASP